MNGSGEIQIFTDDAFLDKGYCEESTFEMKPGAFLKICISDKGSGIAAENLNKIFEPFYTTKEQGKGTGLGLASSYGTIYDHGGEINVQSEIGHGTTFTMYLPITSESIENTEKSETQVTGKGTVLLVDDEEINKIVCSEILESLGFTVLTANDGLEAIDVYRKTLAEINVVLMDMIMPKMSGAEAFYKIREINPNCKVIISSGYTRDESIEELFKRGLTGFIKKPFTINEISNLINEVNV